MKDYQWFSDMYGEVINNLKEETKELTFKIKKARQEENWGTYKNLILAYKEIIKLYKDIVDSCEDNIDKPQCVDNNLTIGFDKATSGLVAETVKGIAKIYHTKDTWTEITPDGLVIKNKEDKKDAYIDVGRDKAILYYKDFVQHIDNKNQTLETLANKILQSLRAYTGDINENINIHIDTTGIGIGISEVFNEMGIKHNKLKVRNR